MKQHLMGLATASMLISPFATALTLPAIQANSTLFTEQASLIEQKALAFQRPEKAKNVILFVGDGMGVSTLTAARILQGQLNSKNGEENFLAFERFPHTSLVKTYNTNQQTPDSAGTMTAMASGVKTKAGVIGLGPTTVRGDCASSKGAELETLVSLAEQKGLSTGIISTARLTHATPAATYAHSPERNWEDDGDLTDEAVANGCKDIARQLIEFPYGDGLEVAMGGGRRHFIPKTENDPEDVGKTGNREDGRNLTSEWLNQYTNAAYVWNKADFDAVDPATTDHLLGLFNRSHMQYEYDRIQDLGGEPSVSDMTAKALQVLSKNDQGYFLMVEAGRIDHAHHAGNAARALRDTIALSDAVQTAVDMTDPDETLIMVTADHSHVFTIAGYPTRGNPILGKVVGNDSAGAPTNTPSTDLDGKPYTTVGYQNGRGFAVNVPGDAIYALDSADLKAGRQDLTGVDTADMDYHQEALVPLSSETHAGEDISIHAQGPGARWLQSVMEQNEVFHIVNKALELNKDAY